MNRMIGKAVALTYENMRNQAEKNKLWRIELVYSRHPQLAELDHQIAAAGARMLFEAIDPDRPKEAARQKERLLDERRVYLKSHGIDSDFDQPKYACSLCNDTGYIGQKQCSCYRRIMMPLLIDNANLNQLSDITFKKFDLNLYSAEVKPELYQSEASPRAYIKVVLADVKKFIDNMTVEQKTNADEQKPGRASNNLVADNMLFVGRPGTGKTFMMACIANEILHKGHTVFYVSAPQLFEILSELRVQQASFQPDPVKLDQLQAKYDSLLFTELLLIDDLGTEALNAAKYSELLSLIDRRLSPGLHTIISSNADAVNISKAYDERLFSRLMGNYAVYRFLGDDIRKKISIKRRQL